MRALAPGRRRSDRHGRSASVATALACALAALASAPAAAAPTRAPTKAPTKAPTQASALTSPKVVVAKAGEATRLALDTTHVYWTSREGVVARAPRRGGKRQVLARGQSKPFAIAVHGGYVYWTNLVGDSICRVKSGGGKVQVLARAQNLPSALVIDAARGQALWLTEVGEDEDFVVAAPLAGGEPRRIARVAGATGLAVDAGHAYVTSSGGFLMQLPLPAGEGRQLVENEVVGYDVAVGLHGAWVTTEAAGTGSSVLRVPLDGGAPVVVARGLDEIFSIALAGDQLWWATRETGEVVRVAAAGGMPERMASGVGQAPALAADGLGVVLGAGGRIVGWRFGPGAGSAE